MRGLVSSYNSQAEKGNSGYTEAGWEQGNWVPATRECASVAAITAGSWDFYLLNHTWVFLVRPIFFCSCSMPYSSASAVGGQPGT